MPSRGLSLALLAILLAGTLPAQTPGPAPPPLQTQAADSSFLDAINAGVQAFKAADYEAAMQHFRQAVLFNPTSTQARLYLGTTYASQVVPSLDTPENVAVATNALETLRGIPANSPESLASLRQIAAIQRNVKRFDDARQTELEVIRRDPTDAEAHYTLGVLDWQQAYKNAVSLLAAAGLQDDGLGNPKLNLSACSELRDRNAPLVEDGTRHLEQALELRLAYDEAMTYLNLTYRRRADFACGNQTQRFAAITQADQWSTRAQQARQENQSNPKPIKPAGNSIESTPQ